MKKQQLLLLVVVMIATAGVWQLAQGAYIYAKAQLAQFLLASAWQESQQTQQPVKPWSWADTWPVAKLEASAHNIDLIILAGDTGRTLAFGPGYNLASVRPGDVGNSIISAHRDTHFKFLQQVKLNDVFVIETQQGKHRKFIVNNIKIVDSRKSSIPLNTDTARLTLVTCYPFDAIEAGGPLRYVVEAQEQSI